MSMPAEDDVVEGFMALPRGGILRPSDALLTIPHRYVDTSNIAKSASQIFDRLRHGQKEVIARVVLRTISGFTRDNKPVHKDRMFIPKFCGRLSITGLDAEGETLKLSVFGAVHAWKDAPLFPDDTEVNDENHSLVLITGFFERGNGITFDAAPVPKRYMARLGEILPLYKGVRGYVTIDDMVATVDQAVQFALADKHHWLEARAKILQEALCDEAPLLEAADTSAKNLAVILRALHRPTSLQEALTAKEAALKVAAAAVQQRSRFFLAGRPEHEHAAISGVATRSLAHIVRIQRDLGITLTRDQANAISVLAASFTTTRPSATMMTGDVGTGKTLAFLIPVISAFESGAQVAILAPTTILADQLARVIVDFFPTTPVARVEKLKDMPATAAVLVGTHGLPTYCIKKGWVADVLVIDEQQKFPAPIREALVAPHTHVVEATATPIPRSMAITMYAGMRQVVLSQVPVQKTLNTKTFYGPGSREEMSRAISRVMSAGKKVAFIYPAVEPPKPDDDEDAAPRPSVANVKEAYERLNARFPGKVAKVFSNMPDAEIRAELNAMRRGEKNILVASILIEVGIDIPELDGMVVSEADRFGLATLHQLRGRLARRGGVGEFLLHIKKARDEVDPKTVERMDAIASTTDGAKLSALDMDMRGFGDTMGDNQSGRGYTIFRGVNLKASDFMKLAGVETPDLEIPDLASMVEDATERAPAAGDQLALI